jgi:hypothetical protein
MWVQKYQLLATVGSAGKAQLLENDSEKEKRASKSQIEPLFVNISTCLQAKTTSAHM